MKQLGTAAWEGFRLLGAYGMYFGATRFLRVRKFGAFEDPGRFRTGGLGWWGEGFN